MASLEPEEGYQYEAGVKYEPSFIDGLLTASIYQITKQNVSVAVPVFFVNAQLERR